VVVAAFRRRSGLAGGNHWHFGALRWWRVAVGCAAAAARFRRAQPTGGTHPNERRFEHTLGWWRIATYNRLIWMLCLPCHWITLMMQLIRTMKDVPG